MGQLVTNSLSSNGGSIRIIHVSQSTPQPGFRSDILVTDAPNTVRRTTVWSPCRDAEHDLDIYFYRNLSKIATNFTQCL